MENSNPFVFVGVVIAILYIVTIVFLLVSLNKSHVNAEYLFGVILLLVLPALVLYIGYKAIKWKERSKIRGI